MRALHTIALGLASLAVPAVACTTFCVRGPDGLYFGRNYDYGFGDGMILVNNRGVEKASLIDRNPARWVSRHGSVTFNQFGKDSPMGGINERGLVVEVMELQETKYPAPDSRAAVGALEWIQYQLDNFASVEEAIPGARRIRVGTAAPIHFLMADRAGEVATVEFLGGRMVVHRGSTLPDRVLANSPYEDSLDYAQRNAPEAGPLPRGIPGSFERFARAARQVKAWESSPAGSAVERSFEILDDVAQPGHTQWQIVYDLKNATIHYRTTANRERRAISVAAFDYACAASGRMLDIDTGRGDMTAQFMPYAAEANERQMLVAFAKSPHYSTPAAVVKNEAARVDARRCVSA